MFPLGYIEDKLLVNCGGFSGDVMSIHDILSYFLMFRSQRGFIQCDSWYIHVNGDDTFQMISFDPINILFKCWLWFEYLCFKAVVYTKRIKILVKLCDI